MACNPPYCLGTGGWCGCNCNCCPPCPCCTSYTYIYRCGPIYEGSCFYIDEGQPVICIGLAMQDSISETLSDFPDFPDFDVDLERLKYDKEYLFSLSTSSVPCSIPCANYTITLSTSGCCLYGSGFSFVAVGSGTVTISGCPSNTVCQSPFTCSINGQGTSVEVADCEVVSVEITPPTVSGGIDDCGCDCCLIDSYCTLLEECQAASIRRSLIQSRRDVSTGKRKISLNKQKLMEKILRKKSLRQ